MLLEIRRTQLTSKQIDTARSGRRCGAPRDTRPLHNSLCTYGTLSNASGPLYLQDSQHLEPKASRYIVENRAKPEYVLHCHGKINQMTPPVQMSLQNADVTRLHPS